MYAAAVRAATPGMEFAVVGEIAAVVAPIRH